MAAPTLTNVQTGDHGNANGTFTVPLAAGTADKWFLHVIDGEHAAEYAITPAGWTLTAVEVTAGVTLAFGRKASTSETSVAVTWTGRERGAWWSSNVSGASFATAMPEIASATGTSTLPNPPALDPSWATFDTLVLAVCGYDNGNVTVTTYPYTSNQTNPRNIRNQGAGIGVCTTTSTGGNVDPDTFQLSGGEQWVAVNIAARAAAAAAEISVALASQVDNALGLDMVGAGTATTSITLSSQVDSALALVVDPAAGPDVTLGLASQADNALPLTLAAAGSTTISLALAAEADNAFGLNLVPGSISVEPAIEPNVAFPLVLDIVSPIEISVALAMEFDNAIELSMAGAGSASTDLSLASQADSAFGLTLQSAGAIQIDWVGSSVGQYDEAGSYDEAGAYDEAGGASHVEYGLPLALAGGAAATDISVALATQSDVAFPLTLSGPSTISVAVAGHATSAFGLAMDINKLAVALASEMSSAFGLVLAPAQVIGTLAIGVDNVRFYRYVAADTSLNRLALVPTSFSAEVGFDDDEGWETVSETFAIPTGGHDAAMTVVRSAWLANKAAARATLRAAIENALHVAGYRRRDGSQVLTGAVVT